MLCFRVFVVDCKVMVEVLEAKIVGDNLLE